MGSTKDIDSPTALAEYLIGLFPSFASEIEGEELTSYHQVFQRIAPVLSGYLKNSHPRTIKKFCALVNTMVDAAGDKENAISTCLLEHASQVGVRKIIRPYLGPAAKRELG
ncbi:MAG: hypothetical protein FJ143_07365 [Deltaproteobacteria bacterium]|nr:hypothetical protein [Deltaproteobacteria bacterium]